MDGRSTTCAKPGWSANARPRLADRHSSKAPPEASSHAIRISAGDATAPFTKASPAPMQTSTARSPIRSGEGSSSAHVFGTPATWSVNRHGSSVASTRHRPTSDSARSMAATPPGGHDASRPTSSSANCASNGPPDW